MQGPYNHRLASETNAPAQLRTPLPLLTDLSSEVLCLRTLHWNSADMKPLQQLCCDSNTTYYFVLLKFEYPICLVKSILFSIFKL